MLVSVHVARAAGAGDDADAALWTHLRHFTGAQVTLSADDGLADAPCRVATATWATMPGLSVKYVRNAHPALRLSLIHI